MLKFNITSFLEKFKQLKDPRENKTIISRIIQETTQVFIPETEISIQKDVVYLQASPLYKNRVFLMKEDILKKINEAIVDLSVKEII